MGRLDFLYRSEVSKIKLVVLFVIKIFLFLLQ